MKKVTTLIIQVYLPAFFMYVGWSMSIPVLPLFARELGAGLGMVGLIVAAKGIGPFILNIPSGILISKYGNRLILLLTMVLALLTSVGSGLARGVGVLLITTLLRGGAQTVWMLSRVHYVRSVVPVEQRGRAIATIGGISRIGGFIGPIIGGVIGKYLGLAWVFLVQAGIIFLVLIHFLVSRKTKETHVPTPENKSEGLSTVVKVLISHKKSFLTAGLVTIAFGVSRTARQVIFPLWGEKIGLDVAQIGLILGLISAVDMTLFFPAGLIMDRKGRKWAAIPALVIMSVSFFILPVAGSFAGLLIIGLVHGLGNGIGSGIVMTMGTDLSPKRHGPQFLSLWFLFSSLGALIGPAVIGYLSEILTLGAASVAAGGIGVAGGAFMLFFVADTLKKTKR